MRVSYHLACTPVVTMSMPVAVRAADVEGLPGGAGQERQVAQQCLIPTAGEQFRYAARAT